MYVRESSRLSCNLNLKGSYINAVYVFSQEQLIAEGSGSKFVNPSMGATIIYVCHTIRDFAQHFEAIK